MTVKQISVFLENKPGQLAKFTEVLNAHGIDMQALSVADAKDFGIVRLIADDSYKTACVLKDENYVFSITPVLAVEMPDKPGGLNRILDILMKNDINLEYTYAFISRKQNVAYMIFRVEDNEKASKVLDENGIRLISQEELSAL